MPVANLHIVASQNIDAKKWNDCIEKSSGLIYATHDWLKHLADNWTGVVVNDYEAVMPIIWRQKLGIKYTYNAPFIQQLGMYGTYTKHTLEAAVTLATSTFKFGDLYFNYNNEISSFLPAAKETTNLILPLNKVYKEISEVYSNHLKRKLKKANSLGFTCIQSNDIHEAVATFQRLYSVQLPLITARHYSKLEAIAQSFLPQKKCFIKKVTGDKNNLLAICLFFKDNNRIYNILPSTTQAGRGVSAMHFLLDHVINEFADTHFTLDFEGSEEPGIKAFYQSFGAINQPYFSCHYNNLPAAIKWLKR